MTGVIDVVFGSLTSLLNPPLFAGLARAFEGSRHDLRMVGADLDGTWTRRLQRRPPAGVVLVPTGPAPDALAAIDALGIPTVVVDTHGSAPADRSVVGATQYRGGRLAAEHLTALGHREIAVLSGPAGVPSAEQRLAGNRDALRAAGVEPPAEWLHELSFSPGSARATCGALLAAAHRPTAIIAGNDLQALDAVEAAERAGVAVPDELSIVGFDDQLLAGAVFPALTTVRQPLRAMGEEAGRILRDLMAHGPERATSVEFLCELVVRESTAPPPVAPVTVGAPA